jgi:hypothetical protein
MQYIKRENSLHLAMVWGKIMSIELTQAATGAPASNCKPYPAYKYSGVEWPISEHWRIVTFLKGVTA